MKNFKHVTHVFFDSLVDKRNFCSKLNKYRRDGIMTIIDLGKDEDGVGVEFGFPTEEALKSFEVVVKSGAAKLGILKSKK